MAGPPFLFQNLKVYQQALVLVDRASTLTSGFSRPNWYVADQLNRASLSVALNIAEGTGRATVADKRRFLVMARGSVHECVALLDVCERRKLLVDPDRAELTQHLISIAKMLAGMVRSIDEAGSVREDIEEYGLP